MMSVASVLLIVMSCCVLAIFSFPNGAPLQACEDLVPRHPLSPQNSVAPYKLVVQALVKDDKNVGLQITVDGSGNDRFHQFFSLAGFLLQVRDDFSGKFVGKLSNVPRVSKYACNTRAAVTHTDGNQKAVSSLQFIWEPLSGELKAPISVRVYATFVKTAAQYWTPVASAPILISPM